MSITASNGHVPKRRKLSHGSDSVPRIPSNQHQDGTKQPKTSGSDDKKYTSAQKSSVPVQRRTGSSSTAPSGLTKSSLLQLQANDLLESIRPEYDHLIRRLKPACDNLVRTIKAIPERGPLTLSEAEKVLRKKHGVAIPFATYRPDSGVQYKFEYKQPDQTTIRGGLTQHLCTKDEMNLEIAVQMPSSLFHDKDYLNYRALHKRAYYTACITSGIKDGLSKDFDCHYDFLDGNDMVPIISLTPLGRDLVEKIPKLRILVNVCFPGAVGPLEKLIPSRSCVKTNAEHQIDNAGNSTATPFYNSTIRSLASQAATDDLIDQVRQKCDSFSDTCVLGQTWLRQRGFGSDLSAGGFGLSEWAYMCALLLVSGGHKGTPLFSERYSSIQLFKAMLQVLANRDLTDPLVVRQTNLQLEKGELPVLFDGENGVNVFSKMDRSSYNALRHYSQLSLTAVNARATDSFDLSFITRTAESSLQFDEVYAVDIASPIRSTSSSLRNLATGLYDVLERGLGDRVSLLGIWYPSLRGWDLSLSEPKKLDHSQKLEIRLLCNPDTAARLIDHGPTAEEQDAARDFRSFWGEKSELRRFRDGSITETLVWEPNTSVTLQVIQYLLALHFKILPSSIKSRTPDLPKERLQSSAPISADDAFKLINNKFQELSSKLHQMDGLPLPIRSITPADPALASATLDHPLEPGSSAPISVHIQFDSSARWPDHLRAIQYTKVAFLAKISDLITESDSSITTRIGVENTNSSETGYCNTSFLDVILQPPASGLSPIIFRLRIHHERELQLLQDLLANKNLPGPTRDMATLASVEYKRNYVSRPAHTAAIRNLITHFPPLSSTIRLLKAWVASHNLSNHISDPALEIIAARVFLQPYPWSTPGSATTAFLRCLYFLSRWDWSLSPLIVDLSLAQDLTTAQLTDLETRYQAWKKLDPNMNTVAWFIGTNVDNTGTAWTQGPSPPKVVAARVTALAKAAIELIKSKGTQSVDGDWNDLFISPVSDYDFVIRLKPSIVRGGGGRRKHSRRSNGQVQFRNLEVQEDLDVDSVGHDVVSLYLADLQKAFANVILFFHGEGGKIIAGLWRPAVGGRKEWRVRLGYSSIPYAAPKDDEGGRIDGLAEVNKDGILAEIALLGEGMIEKISVRD